jgi:hypothetical protein
VNQAVEDVEKDEFVLMQNLDSSMSVFRDTATGQKYGMGRYGYTDSVVEIPRRLMRNSYLHRAARDQKIRFLVTEAEQREVLDNLIPAPVPAKTDEDRLRESMVAGAAAASGNRFRKAIPDDPIQNGPDVPMEQVWTGSPGPGSEVTTGVAPHVPTPASDVAPAVPPQVPAPDPSAGGWRPS